MISTLVDSVVSQNEINDQLNLHSDGEARRIKGLLKSIKDLRTHIGCDEVTIENLEKRVHTFLLTEDVNNDCLEAYRGSNASLRDSVKEQKMDISSLKAHLTKTLAEIWELGLIAAEKARLSDIDEAVKEYLAESIKELLSELRYTLAYGESASGPMVCGVSKRQLLPDETIVVVEGQCCCGKEVTGVERGGFYKHVYAFTGQVYHPSSDCRRVYRYCCD